jgi:hypothetical protein
MHLLSHKKIYSILAFCTILLPGSALASSVSIEANHSEFFVGDTILFSVRIDSEGENINAVEGDVLLDHAAGAVSLTDINTSGSQFSLWPVNPLPSERNTRISFAGGSPGGLTSNNAIIFNIVLKLQETGQVALSLDNIGVYVHDGKGTRDDVSVKDLIIDVLPKKADTKAADDWSSIVLSDTTPPEPFDVSMGQEESVFDGKKFLSFGTTDGQSGVSYYEVIEGTLPPARSSGTYVLQEQQKPVKVTVIAYDSAGNARESVYSSPALAPEAASYAAVWVFMGSILGIFLLVVAFKKMRKTKK